MKCRYIVPLLGRCNKESRQYRYCYKHRKKCSCGKEAIGGCVGPTKDPLKITCGKPTCRKDLLCHEHQEEE